MTDSTDRNHDADTAAAILVIRSSAAGLAEYPQSDRALAGQRAVACDVPGRFGGPEASLVGASRGMVLQSTGRDVNRHLVRMPEVGCRQPKMVDDHWFGSPGMSAVRLPNAAGRCSKLGSQGRGLMFALVALTTGAPALCQSAPTPHTCSAETVRSRRAPLEDVAYMRDNFQKPLCGLAHPFRHYLACSRLCPQSSLL